MPSSTLLILTGKNVTELLQSRSTIDSALESQSRAFKAYSQTNLKSNGSPRIPPIQAPLRTTLTSEDVTTLVMPARADAARGLGGIGIKVVSVPNEGDAGLPATTTIFDEKTGNLRAVVNARALTALRNACGSTLYLQTVLTDPSDHPTHLVLFGSGAQIRAHAILFKSKFPTITSMTIINRRKTDRLVQLGRELDKVFAEHRGTDIEVDVTLGVQGEDGSEMERALEIADVIVTATPSTEPLFPSSAIPSPRIDASGTHSVKKKTIILIGSYKPHMLEIPRELVQRALTSGGKVTVDSREACLAEAGELVGVRPEQIVELGQVLATGQNGQVRADGTGKGEVRIYKSVGIAVQDVAVANAIIEAAKELGIGTIVEDYD